MTRRWGLGETGSWLQSQADPTAPPNTTLLDPTATAGRWYAPKGRPLRPWHSVLFRNTPGTHGGWWKEERGDESPVTEGMLGVYSFRLHRTGPIHPILRLVFGRASRFSS